MGKIVMAAKIAHVPSILISERPGPLFGKRQGAIDGLKEIGRRARERGADTFLVFDVHWLSNFGCHMNANVRHKGVYTSHEAPHMIQNMEYDYRGNPELADMISTEAKKRSGCCSSARAGQAARVARQASGSGLVQGPLEAPTAARLQRRAEARGRLIGEHERELSAHPVGDPDGRRAHGPRGENDTRPREPRPGKDLLCCRRLPSHGVMLPPLRRRRGVHGCQGRVF